MYLRIIYLCICWKIKCSNRHLMHGKKTLKNSRVSNNSSVHHQEFCTEHTAMVYIIQVCWQLASRIRVELYSILPVPTWSFSQAVSKPVWHIPLLCVQWKTPDDGQRNCPKHVEFYSKNKLEKLVHLVGFIVRTDVSAFCNHKLLPCLWEGTKS